MVVQTKVVLFGTSQQRQIKAVLVVKAKVSWFDFQRKILLISSPMIGLLCSRPFSVD